jgi:Zn ribbon nucleic-acid-binding protein
MSRAEEIELMTCILAGYMRYGGRSITELQDAIQDCGHTDRAIDEMTNQALRINNAKKSKQIDKS